MTENSLTSPESSFEHLMALRAMEVEATLDKLLSTRNLEGEIVRPQRLVDAMRHGVLNGGKRLRPFLVLESALLFGAQGQTVLRIAAALECLHSYSLIHDDLPAMDDDDLRRGQPTVHRAYDEATAILAGDALLTMAFEIIASDETELAPAARLMLVRQLARASGVGGMVGGQVLDLAAERERPNEAGIVTLQAMKTGALIRFACEAGAIVGGAPDADRERLVGFGEAVGLAFQLADDLLDITSDATSMGKATGKDSGRGKATLVSMHGENWARQQMQGLIAQAADLLQPYDERAAVLNAAARFIVERQY